MVSSFYLLQSINFLRIRNLVSSARSTWLRTKKLVNHNKPVVSKWGLHRWSPLVASTIRTSTKQLVSDLWDDRRFGESVRNLCIRISDCMQAAVPSIELHSWRASDSIDEGQVESSLIDTNVTCWRSRLRCLVLILSRQIRFFLVVVVPPSLLQIVRSELSFTSRRTPRIESIRRRRNERTTAAVSLVR